MNLNQLKKRCLDPFDAFPGKVVETEQTLYSRGKWLNGKWEQGNPVTTKTHYRFVDNGANVLAVAHLDTVQNLRHFATVKIAGKHYIFNAQVDDRLGAFIILDLLPKYGIKVDVLLTEGEESCNSSAQHFTPPNRQYNWMFSFDRAGTDVVMYQYDHPTYAALLRNAGFPVATGSYSDIAELDFLGCAGFNFGTGYYDNHGTLAHAIAEHTDAMVKKFVHFYEEHAATHLPYIPMKVKPMTWAYGTYSASEEDYCDNCLQAFHYAKLHYTADYVLCDTCLRALPNR